MSTWARKCPKYIQLLKQSLICSVCAHFRDIGVAIKSGRRNGVDTQLAAGPNWNELLLFLAARGRAILIPTRNKHIVAIP